MEGAAFRQWVHTKETVHQCVTCACVEQPVGRGPGEQRGQVYSRRPPPADDCTGICMASELVTSSPYTCGTFQLIEVCQTLMYFLHSCSPPPYP